MKQNTLLLKEIIKVNDKNRQSQNFQKKFVKIHSGEYKGVALLLCFRAEFFDDVISNFLLEINDLDEIIIELYFSHYRKRLLLLLKIDENNKLIQLINCCQNIDEYENNFEISDDYKAPVNPVTLKKYLLRGGSLANKKIINSNNKDTASKKVIKEVTGKDIAENGYSKLRNEILHILSRRSEIRKFYPEINEFSFSKLSKVAKVVMPLYYKSTNLSDLIFDLSIPIDKVKNCYIEIFSSLFCLFYSVNKKEKPAIDYVNQLYFRRVNRRIKQILTAFKSFSPTLNNIISNGFYLNGEKVPPLNEIMNFVQSKKEAILRLTPENLCESHHDLIASNILVNFSKSDMKLIDFKLIDCRGENEISPKYRHWSYDLCKAKFFLSGYEIIRRGYADLKIKPNNKKIEISYGFHNDNEIVKRHESLNHDFFKIISRSTNSIIITKDTHWKEKILFGEGLMYIADIPPRIVDEADEKMAITFYCHGINIFLKYINKFLLKK